MRFVQHSTKDMGAIINRFDRRGRFSLDADRWTLVSFHAQFGHAEDEAGAVATTGNDLTIRVDHAWRMTDPGGEGAGGVDESTMYAWLIHTAKNLGAGADAKSDYFYRLTADEMLAHERDRGDEIVFIWSNPDTNAIDQRWELEVNLRAV